MTPLHPAIFGIPIDFILFGLTLICVAVFHRHTLRVALAGLVTVAFYKILFTGFKMGPGLVGLVSHVKQEWVILTNLLCLLLGFAVLSRHFEKSHLTLILPKYLPHDWKGGLVLLGVVWVLSSFLDNIAGALIGGALAHELFRSKVHIGYVAAIVAASNAGGAWSVLGDTTTTMLWIAGVSPGQVFEAVIGAAVSLFVFGIPAAIKQQRYSPILTHARTRMQIDWVRIAVIALILAFALVANVATNIKFPGYADRFPFIGLAVWTAILVSIVFRAPDWNVIPPAFRSSIFLLSLVLTASMMPVEELPVASWKTALGLGFVSAVFDNIPLTALAIKQGGYDWGFLAYVVGFGGSIIWLGSSSGVALSSMYPEAKSVVQWLRHGWYIIVAYLVGFYVMLGVLGWRPDTPHRRVAPFPNVTSAAMKDWFFLRTSRGEPQLAGAAHANPQ